MIYSKLTRKAMKICFEKHKDQVDKGGMPYIFHPLYVAESMEDEDSVIVALLHDVIEDTDMTIEELRAHGFSDVVIEAIKLLSRDMSMSYMNYIRSLKGNPIARAVKIADLKHNSDLSRLDVVSDKDIYRVKKYQKALKILMDN